MARLVPVARVPATVEQELIAAWPTLPAAQRALWFKVLDQFLPPDDALLETLEQLEDARRLAMTRWSPSGPIPARRAV